MYNLAKFTRFFCPNYQFGFRLYTHEVLSALVNTVYCDLWWCCCCYFYSHFKFFSRVLTGKSLIQIAEVIDKAQILCQDGQISLFLFQIHGYFRSVQLSNVHFFVQPFLNFSHEGTFTDKILTWVLWFHCS